MKNICEQAPLYFYGELDEKQAAQFREHLDGCAACKRELAFLEKMQTALVPSAAPSAVVEQVLRKAKPLPWWRRVYRPALAAVLLCAICVWSFLGAPTTVQKTSDENSDWMSYISNEYDEEYNQFAADFAAFEEEF